MNPVQSSQSSSLGSSAQPALPNGSAAAAILSAAIGCFAVGLFALLGEASKSLAKLFTFYRPTGPLSGVSTLAVLLWLVVWFVLANRWRNRTVAIAKMNAAAFLLLFLGILLTFPPFADLLLGK